MRVFVFVSIFLSECSWGFWGSIVLPDRSYRAHVIMGPITQSPSQCKPCDLYRWSGIDIFGEYPTGNIGALYGRGFTSLVQGYVAAGIQLQPKERGYGFPVSIGLGFGAIPIVITSSVDHKKGNWKASGRVEIGIGVIAPLFVNETATGKKWALF